MAKNTIKRRFVRLADARIALEERERNLVIEARENGWTWDELAKELGLTRQGVRSRYKDLPGRDGTLEDLAS